MFNLPDLSTQLSRLMDILERQVEALESIATSLDSITELVEESHGDDDHI